MGVILEPTVRIWDLFSKNLSHKSPNLPPTKPRTVEEPSGIQGSGLLIVANLSEYLNYTDHMALALESGQPLLALEVCDLNVVSEGEGFDSPKPPQNRTR